MKSATASTASATACKNAAERAETGVSDRHVYPSVQFVSKPMPSENLSNGTAYRP
ncbi:hypothetical protein [Neisseria chenwenguii]|uniref:hypothetical protein n=1 Tax=Neisseria chenwenguii TaxID=1853278 RepID=UPI0012FD7253|nr:hypothetical protein [Neisseria chenwenguii]